MFKRRYLITAVAALVAFTVAGFESTARADDRPTSSAAVTPVGTTADGAALLRGVFFAQGPIGDRLARTPYFYMPDENLRRNRTPEAMRAIDSVLTATEDLQPGFLSTFSTRMRSGDPFRVEAAVNDAADVLKRVAEFRPSTEQEAAGVMIHVDVAIANIGILAVAAAVMVATVLVVVVVVRMQPRSHKEKLEVERAMALLATELRTV
jgi:SdpC family antimicrobial peptide